MRVKNCANFAKLLRSAFEVSFVAIVISLPLLALAQNHAGSESCTVPKITAMQPPQYPAGAVKDHATGKTILLVEIRPDGVPGKISVDTGSGNQELDAAAMEQVAKWRFEPSVCDGTPRTSAVRVPVQFSLPDDDRMPPWEIAKDEQPLEATSAKAEIAYLRMRVDLDRKENAFVSAYSSAKERRFWFATHIPGLTAVIRERVDPDPKVYRGLYAFLCEGPSDQCAATLRERLDTMQNNPLPPPPANRDSSKEN